MAENMPGAIQAGGANVPGECDVIDVASRVLFVEALRFWIKLGFISFSSPAGQIAIMSRELVERRR